MLQDLLRNFFGFKRHDEPSTSGLDDHYSHRDSFRNPIWENDEDDDDIDDFRHHRNGMHFNIFSDPLEITRYFEAQMDNIIKSFAFGFGDENIRALPFAEPKREENLRDSMLRPGFDSPLTTDIAPRQKMDVDLDGKITVDEFSKTWENGNTGTIESYLPHKFSIGKSVRKEIIRRADGTIEKKQIIKDSEGNEETIVSREIGDKKYVITTKKDKDGVETKSEDLINMDENELKDFTQKWTPSIQDGRVGGQSSILNHFPWEKFFGSNPKL